MSSRELSGVLVRERSGVLLASVSWVCETFGFEAFGGRLSIVLACSGNNLALALDHRRIGLIVGTISRHGQTSMSICPAYRPQDVCQDCKAARHTHAIPDSVKPLASGDAVFNTPRPERLCIPTFSLLNGRNGTVLTRHPLNRQRHWFGYQTFRIRSVQRVASMAKWIRIQQFARQTQIRW